MPSQKHDKARSAAREMGQSSSQPIHGSQAEDPQANMDQQFDKHLNSQSPEAARRKKHKKKKHRREREDDSAHHSKEEESARTLLEMKGSHSQDMERQQYANNDDLAASSQIALENQLQSKSDVAVEDEEQRARHERHKKKKSRKEHKNRSERHAQRRESSGEPQTINQLMENVLGPPEPYPQIAQANVTRPIPSQTNNHLSQYNQSIDQSFQVLPSSTAQEPSSAYSGLGDGLTNVYDQNADGYNASPSVAVAEKKKRKKRAPIQRLDLANTASAANALIDPALTAADQNEQDNWSTVESRRAPRATQNAEHQEHEEEQAPAPAREGSLELYPPSAAKRKRTEAEPPSEPARAEKRSKTLAGSKKKGRGGATSTSNGQESATSGPFTKYEIDQLTEFFERYRDEHDMTQFDLNEKIQATNRSSIGIRDDFWTDVANVLPYRTRQSIYKVCRRRFHNFGKRGQWTSEEDERLRLAQIQKPNRWKAIGEMIGRMPEDCRDRWRNYLKCGDQMNKDIWTEQEERLLRNAIDECITSMREAKAAERAAGGEDAPEEPENFEDLVNWSVVSEKMAGARSRLQCLYKWKKLKIRDAEEERKARLEAEGVLQSDRDQGPKITWRVKQSEQKISKMLPGDKFHLLQSISESGTYEEKNIPWKIVGSPDFRAIWTTTDRKWAFHKMKQTMPNVQQLSLQDVVLGLMDRIIADHPTELSEHYIPSPEDEEAAAKKRRKKKLSTTMVDEDLGDDHAGRAQPHFDTSMAYDDDAHGGSQDHRNGHDRTSMITDDVVDPSLRDQTGVLDSTHQQFVDGVDREMAQRVGLLRGA